MRQLIQWCLECAPQLHAEHEGWRHCNRDKNSWHKLRWATEQSEEKVSHRVAHETQSNQAGSGNKDAWPVDRPPVLAHADKCDFHMLD